MDLDWIFKKFNRIAPICRGLIVLSLILVLIDLYLNWPKPSSIAAVVVPVVLYGVIAIAIIPLLCLWFTVLFRLMRTIAGRTEKTDSKTIRKSDRDREK